MNCWKLLVPAIGLSALVALCCWAADPPTAERERPPASPASIPPTIDGDAQRILALAAKAYRTKLSIIADNLANAETVAFKRSRVRLESLSYRHETPPGAEDTLGEFAPVGISVGTGVRIAGVQTDFSQGAFWVTDCEFDVAIEGAGFFQVTDPNGDILYTRAGNFTKNANGSLVTASSGTGRLLQPPITIPGDATAVVISPEGIVSVQQQGTSSLTTVGQIELARFANPQGLLKRGENLYAETDASGMATLGNPGQDGLGRLRQGALEASNVEPDQEQIEFNRTAAVLQRIDKLLQIE